MANILFTWEMGANLGHLDKLRAFMPLAAREGHTLSAALRNLRYASMVLAGLDYRCFQAPHHQAVKPRPAPQSLSSTHTLEDFCFPDPGELALRIKAWREIFDAVEPDLLYAEYSPGALIASRGLGIPQVTIGNGFMTPPIETRDGVFAPYATTPNDDATLARLERDDARVLELLNDGCRRAGVPVFSSLGEIMGQAEQRYLTTLPDLDHFNWRDGGCYLGTPPPFGVTEPRWPIAGEASVFCYLQDFPGLVTLLKELTDAGARLLVYRRESSEALSEQFARVPNIRFTSEPMDLSRLRDTARFIVHHAGHGVAALCAEYGVPQLCIPTQQEELLTAYQLERTGIGITALHNQQSFAAEISTLMRDDNFQRRARTHRDRYAAFNWADSERRFVADMAAILGG